MSSAAEFYMSLVPNRSHGKFVILAEYFAPWYLPDKVVVAARVPPTATAVTEKGSAITKV